MSSLPWSQDEPVNSQDSLADTFLADGVVADGKGTVVQAPWLKCVLFAFES